MVRRRVEEQTGVLMECSDIRAKLQGHAAVGLVDEKDPAVLLRARRALFVDPSSAENPYGDVRDPYCAHGLATAKNTEEHQWKS